MNAPDRLPKMTNRQRLALGAILLLSLFLNSLGLSWGLPNEDSWSNDDPTPRAQLRIYEAWAEDYYRYPYLQLIVDRVLYEPYIRQLRENGGLPAASECEPIKDCFAEPHVASGVLILISRWRSVLLGMGIVLAAFLLGVKAFGDREAGLFAALLAAVTEVLVFFAHQGNMDTPYTFWFSLSMIAALGIVFEGKLRDYALFGFFAAAALASKDGIVGAYGLLGLALLVVHVRRVWEERGARDLLGLALAFVDRRLLALAGWLLVPYALIMNVVGNFEGFKTHALYWVEGEGSVVSPRGWLDAPSQGYEMMRRMDDGMGLPLLLLCVAGMALVFWRRERVGWWLVLPGLSYFVLIMSRITHMDTRFVMPVAVLLCVAGGDLAARMWRAEEAGLRMVGRGVLLAVIGYSFLYCLNADLSFLTDGRYLAEAWLEENVEKDVSILAPGIARYNPRIEYLGYEDVDFPDWDEVDLGVLAEQAPDVVILSEKSFKKLDGPQGEMRDVLLDGSAGYEVLWDGKAEEPLGWLPGTYVESRVNPRVVILRRPR
jgi:hypothetical protein